MNIWTVKQMLIGWLICCVFGIAAVALTIFSTLQVWELGFRIQRDVRLTIASNQIDAEGGESTTVLQRENPDEYWEETGGDQHLTNALGDIAFFRLFFAYGFLIGGLMVTYLSCSVLHEGYFSHAFKFALSAVFGRLLVMSGLLALAAVGYQQILSPVWMAFGIPSLLAGTGLLILGNKNVKKGVWNRTAKRQLVVSDFFGGNKPAIRTTIT